MSEIIQTAKELIETLDHKIARFQPNKPTNKHANDKVENGLALCIYFFDLNDNFPSCNYSLGSGTARRTPTTVARVARPVNSAMHRNRCSFVLTGPLWHMAGLYSTDLHSPHTVTYSYLRLGIAVE